MTRNNIILTICLIIVISGVGYFVFGRNTADDVTIITTAGPANDAELSFITLVTALDPIVFDTKLLSDPRFTGRQDIRTAIIPETGGRRDPFAPLGR